MPASLLALACHFTGDFPLQSDKMAVEKFEDRGIRAKHCAIYTLTFMPFVLYMDWGMIQGLLFATLVYWSHYAVDSRRWAENYESFPTRSLWFDQAYHIICLAAIVVVVDGIQIWM